MTQKKRRGLLRGLVSTHEKRQQVSDWSLCRVRVHMMIILDCSLWELFCCHSWDTFFHISLPCTYRWCDISGLFSVGIAHWSFRVNCLTSKIKACRPNDDKCFLLSIALWMRLEATLVLTSTGCRHYGKWGLTLPRIQNTCLQKLLREYMCRFATTR